MSQAKYYILLLVVCLIWGATPASGKFTVEAFSPLLITGTRFAIMAAILFLYLIITGNKKDLKPSREVLYIAAAMGFMGILVHNGLLFYGLNYTTATNTALIESIGPTATTILAFFFLGERLSKGGWVGIAISCVGAVTIVSKGSINNLLNLEFNYGDIMILVCEIAWSAYAVISWNIHGRIGTIGMTAWSGMFGALMCYSVGAVTGTLEVYTVTQEAILGFGYLVFFSGLFAFVSWNYAMSIVGASKAGVFVYLVPLTGGFVGVLFLGEEILPAQIIGAFLILFGVVITTRAKVNLKVAKDVKAAEKGLPTSNEKDLLQRFPELAQKHNEKLAAKGVEIPNASDVVKSIEKAAIVKDKLAAQSAATLESATANTGAPTTLESANTDAPTTLVGAAADTEAAATLEDATTAKSTDKAQAKG
ncbi:MAG: DMT family transporter [Anaerobiospirillum succiniciproducens]|uniref:DMT family transporter n=1 Tax=Anaerobiospirillum succiniciproducens TaxID=13335 RepID=UPI0026DAE1DF|nr:DMT family transporter [Anaerobiospirillum succiniciproducens]MDO4675812.1 DMT family transporter [Anaerobiospirillum succiniciproducens]